MSDEGIQLHDIARVAHIGLGGALPGYKGKLSEIEYKVIAKAVAEFVIDAKPDQPYYDKMRGIVERLVSPDDAGLGALIADARELLKTINTYNKAREVLAAAEPNEKCSNPMCRDGAIPSVENEWETCPICKGTGVK